MSNYHRAYQPGACWFFTVVTNHRHPWFADTAHIEILRQAFSHVRAQRPFVIDAIAILPDHIHTIWQLPEGDSDFSGRWREIKKFVSKRIDTRRNQRGEGMVWQRRFWEHLLRDEQDWRQHMDYVHYNPVKHGYANSPAAWPWSSFQRAVARGLYVPEWGDTMPASINGMHCE